ncbi:MAG: ABC transporter ATP-binding protein [Coriobacteriaceae bacterium]|jgi:ABC-2 type transport system ATP-binding protein|nr:ABC transporter ATP-binding protein [Coriobacteriaceae bacterium]
MSVVYVENLVKRYKEVLALDHFNLDIKQGEIFGLLGPNGSGKTTAINCMLQLLTYDKGVIKLFGQDMTPSRYDLKKRIGIVPQNIAVFEELTVTENVDYFCALYVSDKAVRTQLVKEAIEFVGLEEYVKFRPRKLSGGLIRRLNIACGIVHKPELIFLDEPTVAVDPQSRNAILEGIRSLNRNGSTIVYTSHYMEEVEEICTRIMIMDHGQILASGTNNELKAMIGTGEKIQVEVFNLSDEALGAIKALNCTQRASYDGKPLEVSCSSGAQNLSTLLQTLQQFELVFGRVYSEPPTLNDVFLELTGTELRD